MFCGSHAPFKRSLLDIQYGQLLDQRRFYRKLYVFCSTCVLYDKWNNAYRLQGQIFPQENISKKNRKTLIPFIAWSVIGAFYQYYAGRLHIDWTVEGVKTLIAGMMNTHVITVYWFSYICSAYIFVYRLLRLYQRRSEKKYSNTAQRVSFYSRYWFRSYAI